MANRVDTIDVTGVLLFFLVLGAIVAQKMGVIGDGPAMKAAIIGLAIFGFARSLIRHRSRPRGQDDMVDGVASGLSGEGTVSDEASALRADARNGQERSTGYVAVVSEEGRLQSTEEDPTHSRVASPAPGNGPPQHFGEPRRGPVTTSPDRTWPPDASMPIEDGGAQPPARPVLVARAKALLIKDGWAILSAATASTDGGIDILAGRGGVLVAVQCHAASSGGQFGAPEARRLLTAPFGVHGAKRVVLISNSSISVDAWAVAGSAPEAVRLVDCATLVDWEQGKWRMDPMQGLTANAT